MRLSNQKIKEKIYKFIISIILIFLSSVFIFPFLWLISTAVKPIEQTMQMPPVWLPKAYYIKHNGKRVQVIYREKEDRIDKESCFVKILESKRKGEEILVPYKDIKNNKITVGIREADVVKRVDVRVDILKNIPAGYYQVSEKLPEGFFERKTGIFFVQKQDIQKKIKFEFRNFINVTKKIPFFLYLRNTLIVCVLGVLGALISNSLVAYGFSKINWKGRDTVFYIALATMMIPFPVTMIPLFTVFRKFGMTGTLMPLWVPAFFGSAFNIFLLRQFFRTIPNDLIEAAKIDGCNEFQIFYRLILPLSKPILTVIALFHFMYAWNDFMGPLIYLTNQKTFTLSLGLQFFQSQHGGTEWHLLMAASAMVILPVIVLFFFAQKTFIENITLTGTKG